jgi:Zn ribbon nucleic-acid-binding protein
VLSLSVTQVTGFTTTYAAAMDKTQGEIVMIKVRCYKCGNAFQLTEQHVANALAAEELTRKPAHYTAECPQCRQAIKIPLKRVRLPEPEVTEESSTTEAES